MASLIKNQILKHLSKFAKNLTVDQINVEVLKGKGALENIELNEVVLTEVLELPAWLRVQKATCNKIAVKIPWTSLKTSPVVLFVDEIRVEMVMSSEFLQPRATNASAPSTPGSSGEYSSATGYGFANRVVEGMSLYINTVEVFFTSEKFGGSFLLSRLCVESRTPTWKEATDLHNTRIRDHRLHQVLVFKQISWQLLRIEASNVSLSGSGPPTGAAAGYNINAPLRLITNQGRCRVTMKKSTVDGSVIAARLQLILGDILWVATLPQVRSVINFYLYLMDLIRKAAEVNKVQKAEKVLQQADLVTMTAKSAVLSGSKLAAPPQHQNRVSASAAVMSDVFQQFDVVETSYHLYGARIDLHISDEANEEASAGGAFPKTGAAAKDDALQLSMQKLSLDFYPFHLAAGERSSWIYYKDRVCRQWITSSLDAYYGRFSSKLDESTRAQFQREWPKLMSQCCVIRLDDITVYCLTKASDKAPAEKLLSCDREILKLPDDMPVLHAEFTDYYYASGQCRRLPLPPSNTHVQWNPVRLFLDYKTLRWMSYVYTDICNTLGLKSSSFETVPHHDVHVEALMPRLVVPTDDSISGADNDPNKPTLMYIQAANVLVDNTTNACRVKQDALDDYVSRLREYSLFGDGGTTTTREELPWSVGGTRLSPLPTDTDAFRRYLATLSDATDYAKNSSACTDIWTVCVSPVWIDFFRPNSAHYPRPLPFLSDVPLTIWLIPNITTTTGTSTKSETDGSKDATAATVTVLVRVDGAAKLVMNCDQYRFVQAVLDDVADLLKHLMADANQFATTTTESSTATASNLSCSLSVLVPTVDLSFLLPIAAGDTPPQLSTTGASSERAASRNSVELSSPAGYPGGDPGSSTNLNPIPVNPILNNTPPIEPLNAFQLDLISTTNNIDASSIDVALGSLVIPEDAVSVVSDDDQFVQIDSPDVTATPFDDIFQTSHRGGAGGGSTVGQRTIEAMDAYEEEKGRICDHNKTTAQIDLTTRLLQRKVSTVTFRLRQCQSGFAYAGDEWRLFWLAPRVDAEENHDITLEEVHRLLTTKAPIGTDPDQFRDMAAIVPWSGDFPLEIRAGCRDPADAGYLHVDVRKFELTVQQENLIHLCDFLQPDASRKVGPDESNNTAMMNTRVRVTDSIVLLKDPVSEVPVQVQLDRVRVLRTNGDTGTRLEFTNDGHHDEGDILQRVSAIERENAELRKKLNEAKVLIQKLAKDKHEVTL